MKREDKFAPVITIVIYYGNEEWDGAKRLHEMLKIPTALLPFVNDYGLNLVEARSSEFIFHNKNNKDLFELTKILLEKNSVTKEIRQKVEAYCREHEVDHSVIRMILAALNGKMDYEKVKEDGDMCTVFEEIRAEGKMEGRLSGIEDGAKGIIQMGKEFKLSNDNILMRLQENFGISLEDAKKYLDKFSK